MAKHFQGGLGSAQIGLAGREVDSLDLTETYAANGFGIGLPVAAPGTTVSADVRVLKLDDSVPVVVGVLWRCKTDGLDGDFFGGMPAPSITVAGRAARTRGGMSS